VAYFGKADGFVHDRAIKCREECQRRGLHNSGWRGGPRKLVA
jgi:hypothetical protein